MSRALPLFVLLLTACAEPTRRGAFGEPPVSRDAYAAYVRGAVAEHDGDLVTAERELSLAARLAPDDAGPRLALARVSARAGQLDRAEARYRAIAARWPRSQEAALAVARLAERRGHDDAARQAYREAQGRFADDVELALAWARFELDRGQPRQVVALLEPLADRDPQVRGVLARARRRAGDARGARDTALRLPASDPAGVATAFWAHLALGDQAAGKRLLAQAWPRGARDDGMLGALVFYALEDGGPADAAQLLGALATLDLTTDDALMLADAALSADARDVALTMAEKAQAERPGGASVQLLARALFRRGASDRALAVLDADPDGAGLAIELALAAGDARGAARRLAAAKDLEDRKALEAALAELEGKPEEAATILAGAGDDAAMARAQLAVRQGRLGEALELVAAQLRRSPDDPGYLNLAGYLRVAAGKDLPAAEPLLARALALSPQDAAIMDSWGMYLLGVGRKAEALRCLAHAARLAPAEAEIHWHHGLALAALGRDGKPAFRQALALGPEPWLRAELRRRLP